MALKRICMDYLIETPTMAPRENQFGMTIDTNSPEYLYLLSELTHLMIDKRNFSPLGYLEEYSISGLSDYGKSKLIADMDIPDGVRSLDTINEVNLETFDILCHRMYVNPNSVELIVPEVDIYPFLTELMQYSEEELRNLLVAPVYSGLILKLTSNLTELEPVAVYEKGIIVKNKSLGFLRRNTDQLFIFRPLPWKSLCKVHRECADGENLLEDIKLHIVNNMTVFPICNTKKLFVSKNESFSSDPVW